jgi:hypothetical protein
VKFELSMTCRQQDNVASFLDNGALEIGGIIRHWAIRRIVQSSAMECKFCILQKSVTKEFILESVASGQSNR